MCRIHEEYKDSADVPLLYIFLSSSFSISFPFSSLPGAMRLFHIIRAKAHTRVKQRACRVSALYPDL